MSMLTQVTQPPPPAADRLSLRSGGALGKDAVIPSVGKILGVSLLTANREAAGHSVWIDSKTLDTFQTQLSGRSLKAYITHGWGDATLNEVGLWTAARIDTTGAAPQLRADFGALDAWKKHSAAEFETLFELAEKAPEEFGASLSFRMELAWVRKDGSEVPTKPSWRASPGRFERVFDPPAPADAVREMPSVRAVEVYSADFVDTPAANDGLLRAQVDAPGNGTTSPTQIIRPMYKDIFAKYHAHPKRLARALELHTTDEKLSFDAIVAKVEGERVEAELGELRTQVETLTTAATGHAAALSAKDTEIAQLKAQATKDAEAIATFRKGGAAPINTGAGTGEPAAANTMTRAEWSKLPGREGSAFILKGGRLTD